MKICPKCKTESEDWQVFCKECGERLPEQVREQSTKAEPQKQQPPVPETEPQKQQPPVPKTDKIQTQSRPAGNEVPQRNGQPAPPIAQGEINKLKKWKKRGILFIVLTAVCVCACAVFVLVGVQKAETAYEEGYDYGYERGYDFRKDYFSALEADYESLETKYDNMKSSYDALEAEKTAVEASLMQLSDEYNSAVSILDFYNKYAVVVPNNGSGLYHKYGCEEWDGTGNFWIYNEKAAQANNYQPCSKCIGE